MIGYESRHRVAEWAAWRLRGTRRVKSDSKGAAEPPWEPDLSLQSAERTALADFDAVGMVGLALVPYHHLLPCGIAAAGETRLLSNCVLAPLWFRDGIWAQVGRAWAGWAGECGEIRILAGPVFHREATRAHVSRRDGEVGAVDPTAGFFTMAIRGEANDAQVLALLVRWTDPDRPARGDTPLRAFETTVREVESATGWHYFPDANASFSARLEAPSDPKLWWGTPR